MSNTALPAIHLRSKARITVEADQPLAWELDQYKAFYAQVHGAPVEEADLLREMARAFMASDREFQRFRRKRAFATCMHSRKPAPATGKGNSQ